MILNQKEIRTQVLEESNFNEGKLFKLEQGWILRLKLSTKIIDQNVKVYCNLPPDPALEFTRSKYFEYKWKYLANSIKNDEFNKFVDINCHLPGAFNFYFAYAEQSEQKKGGSNFLVDPKLCLKDGQVVQAESLQFHTFLSKLLGPLDEWKSRLQVSKETGYNMIHFTPVQGLSRESNSSYSIRDHLNLLEPADSNGKFGLHDLKNLVQEIYNDWNMFSLCDLVYNHMSNDSEFLKQHPNGAYNLVNSPHLIPAFVLDRIFYHATLDISKGVYTARGISAQNPSQDSMEALRHILRWEVIPKYHLEDYFCADVTKILSKIKEIGLAQLAFIEKNLDLVKNGPKKGLNEEQKRCVWNKFGIIQDKEFKKLGSCVDYDLVVDLLSIEFESLRLDLDLINSGENSNLLIGVYEKFSILLNQKNEQIKSRLNEYLTEAVNNVISNYYYFFFAPDGPKWSQINKKQPIVQTYFYFPFEDDSVLGDEKKVCCQDGLRIQAHNGWVMGDDPLRNFADESSTVYLRRQLIPWGDSVKLRYGNCPEDNLQLWTFMEDYTRQTAQIFHGVRLDNCHSTPIHVAQYYLDIARQVRPNLFVIAELFTNSEFIDNKFVAELGITSLVRESMNAWNANELGRLVHRFGGIPVGSFFQSSNRALQEGIAHAIFYDVTHDNKCLITSRSVYDAFASSSLVLMCDCAVGSTRGFDELVPHHINVVTETRPYKKWDQKIDQGIQKGKLLMNNLHFEMGVKGYSQIYVDQFDDDTTVVTRHNPSNHESYILISRTSFGQPNEWTPKNVSKPLYVPSRIERVVFEAGTVKIADSDFKPSDDFINGLENFHLNIQENVNLGCSSFIDFIDYDGSRSLVNFKNFPPGSVICFKVVLNDESKSELPFIRKSIAELLNTNINQESFNNEIETILNRLNFDELNILLYRCSQEETSEGIFSDVYNVPNYGPLVYAGIQGFISVMERERLINNLGHPLFQNLRNGDWILNYTADRLKKYAQLSNRENLMALHQWLFRLFGSLSHLPRYLIPAYFDLIISGLYNKSTQRSLWLMSASNQLNTKLENFDLINASKFLEGLCLAGISLVGNLTSAKLPDTIIRTDTEPKLSLSAGLPHFSTTYMRNWGRDTFISIPGLLLLTNRFTDAKNLILSYGSCLRHGLIPNLLSEGKSARYNCRDSIWWWLKSVKDYTELAPNGYEILDDSIYRLYPTDDSEHPSPEELANRKDSTKIQKLCDVIQEAMSIHLNGLKFRERNAGTQIDDRMKPEGFNNEIGVDLETGFVFGGNEWNAGTWMDKMGSSEKTGNTGYPATPRDGSAVELVGLCRCALEFLITAYGCGKYPYDGVVLKSAKKITWSEWAKKIDENFEKYFWIGDECKDNLVNRCNVYKDTVNSTHKWTDYQMRPNFLIALVVAPQMVRRENALKSLEQVKKFLINDPNTIGIKTLDESDFNYNGYYDNSNDSCDRRVAQGFNYHNGPEWLWPVGFYLRSLLMYSNDKENVLRYVKKHLGKLYDTMFSNDWRSLPELTNKDGQVCSHSCVSQAWSLATILELAHDLSKLDD